MKKTTAQQQADTVALENQRHAFLTDRPEIPKDPSFVALLDSVVWQIERQATASEPDTGSPIPAEKPRLFFGVWGERGQGKSSFLWMLADKLRECDQKRGSKEQRYWLPFPEIKGGDNSTRTPPLLIDTEGVREFDDDVALILDYLSQVIPHDENELINRRNRKHAIPDDDCLWPKELRRDELVREKPYAAELLKFAMESSGEEDAFIDRLEKLHTKSHRSLREIGNRLRTLLQKKNKRVLILVDDPDLSPKRAVKLLRVLHDLCHDERFIVVIAANQELLIDGIVSTLRDDGIGASLTQEASHRSIQDLAERQLQKLVPYPTYLPYIPPYASGVKLWEYLENSWRAIHSGDAVSPLLQAMERGCQYEWWEGKTKAEERDYDPLKLYDPPKPSHVIMFSELVNRCAPRLYRDMISVANLIVQWWNHHLMGQHFPLNAFLAPLGDFGWPMLAVGACVHVAHPSLGLAGLLNRPADDNGLANVLEDFLSARVHPVQANSNMSQEQKESEELDLRKKEKLALRTTVTKFWDTRETWGLADCLTEGRRGRRGRRVRKDVEDVANKLDKAKDEARRIISGNTTKNSHSPIILSPINDERDP